MRIRYRVSIAFLAAVTVAVLIYGAFRLPDIFEAQAPFQRIAIHPAPILDMAFSADGQRLITAGTGGVATLWDMRTGDAIVGLHEHATPRAVAILPGSRKSVLLLTQPFGGGGFQCELALWDLESNRARILFSFADSGSALGDLAPDGSALAFACTPMEVEVCDPLKDEQTPHRILAQDGAVTHLRFSRDGRFLVVGYEGGTVLVWDRQKAAAVRLLPGHEALRAVAIAPTGRSVALCREHGGVVLKTLTGSVADMYLGADRSAGMSVLEFSPDGSLLACARKGVKGVEVQLWDLQNAKLLQTFALSELGVSALEFYADGTQLAVAVCRSGSYKGVVYSLGIRGHITSY